VKNTDEIKICLGSSCFSRGNKEMVEEIKLYLEKNHLNEKIVFKGSHCLGNCEEGPNISINNKTSGNIHKSNITRLLNSELNINK